MKNYWKYITGCLLLGAVASCSDAPDELLEANYDRLFSPTEIETRVRNAVDVTVSWVEVNKATSYTLELYLGETLGETPLRTDESTTTSFTYEGLEGENDYFVRVKAVGEGITDSKWTETTFKTGAEQIFEAVANADLEAKQVTLRWPAGEDADIITLTPGDIVYQITPEDIAAGCATIMGLTPEKVYTAVMTRGTYLIPAEEGAGQLAISSNITLNCVDADNMPVINGCIAINNGASLTANNIVFDGTGTESHAFDFVEAGNCDHLSLSGCVVRNYSKGFFYLNVATLVNTITVDNCLIHGVECSGSDMFDCRSGAYNSFTLSNSTVWNSCAARDFIRMDDQSGAFAGVAPVITVTNCTLDGCSNNSSRRLLYVRFKGNTITFTNNMVSNMPDCGRGFSDSGNTAVPTFSNNNYWNTKNLVSEGGEGKAKFFDTEGTTLDPGYKDAANGDFTLSNEDLIYEQIGDPRWFN